MICQSFYHVDKGSKSLTAHFMEFKKLYEELNIMLPLSVDIKKQQTQRKQRAIMSFFAGLPPEYETVRFFPVLSSILFSKSLTDYFE